MALDSKAAFRERGLEIGLPVESLDALEAGGIASFSQFAFCCAYQPGSQNDDVLFDHLQTMLADRATGATAAAYRRLFFECHAMALRDLQSRLDRSDASEVKILPLAEKVQRVEALRNRLPGVMLSTTLEPSHHLIDRAVHQAEENCVRLIELSTCTSREQEIKNDKTQPQLSFDSSGNIKVTKQSQITECSIQGDIRLRSAFTRRSLAYALANVATFEKLEAWTQLLFDRICQDPPAGYKHISVEQILQADRKLWVMVSEATRPKVNLVTDGVKAVDAALDKFSHHPDVQFHMLPLPLYGPASSGTYVSRPAPYQSQPASKGAANQGGAKGKSTKGSSKGSKGGKIVIPEGCAIKYGDTDRPICMKFNVGACRANIKAGKRCMHGYHVCWKIGCNRPCAHFECMHGG